MPDCLPDIETLTNLLADYRAAFPSGSYLVLTHGIVYVKNPDIDSAIVHNCVHGAVGRIV